MCRIDGETRQMNDLQSAHQGSGYCKPGDLLSVIIRAGLAGSRCRCRMRRSRSIRSKGVVRLYLRSREVGRHARLIRDLMEAEAAADWQ